MTPDPLHVDAHRVRNLARVQSDVASALDTAADASETEITRFEQRYGPIAEPVRTPLGAILAARVDALNTLSRRSFDLAERLHGAAQAYETADETEAVALRDSEN